MSNYLEMFKEYADDLEIKYFISTNSKEVIFMDILCIFIPIISQEKY